MRECRARMARFVGVIHLGLRGELRGGTQGGGERGERGNGCGWRGLKSWLLISRFAAWARGLNR